MLQTWKRSILMVAAMLVVLTAGSGALAGKPVFHGIVSQGYMNSTDYNYLAPTVDGTFAYNEFLLNVSAPVSDKLRVGAQVMSRNLGGDGNEDVVLDWAYGDYRWKDWLGIRIGKVKTPFGLYNQTRDVDMVRNSILLPQAVYTESMRDVMNGFEGASIYGSFSVGDANSFEYDAFLGTVDVERTMFPVGMLTQNILAQIYGSNLPLTEYKSETKAVYGGALRWNTFVEGLRFGASWFHGELSGTGTVASPLGPITPTFHMDATPWYVLSAEYTTDRWLLAYEFNRAFVDMELSGLVVPTGLPDPFPPTVEMDLPIEDRRGGWYAQTAWQFNDYFQFGGIYGVYYPDYRVREGDGFGYKQQDFALTIRADVTDNWLLKVEGHAMKGTGDVAAELNKGIALTDEDWYLLVAKSTFYF